MPMHRHMMHISSIQAGKFDHLKMRSFDPLKVRRARNKQFHYQICSANVTCVSPSLFKIFQGRSQTQMEGGEPTLQIIK